MATKWIIDGVGTSPNNTIISANGQDWTAVNNGGTTLTSYVYVGNNTWVGIGASNGTTIYRSTDGGVSWSGISGLLTTGYDIAYDSINNILIAVGLGGSGILRSTDKGLTWSSVPSVINEPNYGYRVAYGNGKWFVVVKGIDRVLISTNGGENWTIVHDFNNVVVSWITTDGIDTWILGNSTDTYFSYSTDGGMSWSDTYIPEPYTPFTSVSYGGGVFIAGSAPYVYRSTNGVNWTNVSGTLGSGEIKDIGFDGTTWILVGSTNPIAFKSTDSGLTWASMTIPLTEANRVSVFLPVIVNVSYVINTDIIKYSADNTLWYFADGVTKGYSQVGRSVAYGQDSNGNPMWVATGIKDPTTGVSVQYSPDGIFWYNSNASFFYGANAVVFGSNPTPVWVVVGFNINDNSIKYSSDGQNWVNATTDQSPGSITFGLAYNNGVWLVGADTSIFRSTNGSSWTRISTIPSSVRDIAYGNGLWIAWCVNTAYWSENDGTTWTQSTGVTNGTNGMLATDRNGIWVFAGNNGVFRSLGGKTDWTGTTGFAAGFSPTGVIYNAPGWIVVGLSANTNNVYYSPTGEVWNTTGAQPLSNNTFTAGIARLPFQTPTTTAAPTTAAPTTTTTTAAPTTTTTTAAPCFVQGTRVLTPTGYKRIEELQSGDIVLTAAKRRVPIKLYSFTIDKATSDTAPYRIPANTLGRRIPKNDIHLSSRHAVKDAKGRWQIPKYLDIAQQYGIGEPVTYYHIECPDYYRDNLLVEETEVESYKNNQGSSGVLYMWDETLGGWERLPPNKMTSVPKNPKTFMIYSYQKT